MDYSRLLNALKDNDMSTWAGLLESQIEDYFKCINHGDYPRWQQAIDNLPTITPSSINLNNDSVQIGVPDDVSEQEHKQIEQQLKGLMPWRKGPFNLYGIEIDSEWQSWMKWNRFSEKIKPLANRTVLDIGCGNGYYGWRMLGCNAKYVVGLDPTLLFLMQFQAIKKNMPDSNIDIIPFGIQTLPGHELNFDTVFSMGVLYHRRNTLEHLNQLKGCLKPGGEMVLETLIIADDVSVQYADELIPDERYAKMNNVWSIPSQKKLIERVAQAGFENVCIIDVTQTTTTEQRRTDWMVFESLSDFLDPNDNNKTIEAYPAPRRAILLADKA